MFQEPVHVFYAGAHLIRPGLLEKLKAIAINTLELHSPGHHRIRRRLERAAIQDLRIDFEDGLGARSDSEEDSLAKVAGSLAADAQAMPPLWGIRLKSMAPTTRRRALETLDLFVQSGAIPPVVTLPKIGDRRQVEDLVACLDARGLPCRLELMVETAYAVKALPDLIDACQDRCAAIHFGAYDFLSELGVPGPDQSLDHRFCDQARYSMQLAVASTGTLDSNAGDPANGQLANRAIRVVDGVTTLLPLGEHAQAAWRQHMRNVRRSLAQGFYASWDLHPAQVAARYVALFAYFDQHKAAMGQRLANFTQRQTRATRVGSAFDDAASVRGLARFFARAVHSGALEPEELPALTGLALEGVESLL